MGYQVKLAFFLLTLWVSAFGQLAADQDGFSNGRFIYSLGQDSEGGVRVEGWELRSLNGPVVARYPESADEFDGSLYISGARGRQRMSAFQFVDFVTSEPSSLVFKIRGQVGDAFGAVSIRLGDHVVFHAGESVFRSDSDSREYRVDLAGLELSGRTKFIVEGWVQEGNTSFWLDDFRLVGSDRSEISSIELAPDYVLDDEERRSRTFLAIRNELRPGPSKIPLFVELTVNETNDGTDLVSQSFEIIKAQAQLETEWVRAGLEPNYYQFRLIPFAFINVGLEELEVLESSEVVTGLFKEQFYTVSDSTSLEQSAKSLGAAAPCNVNVSGKGTAVAILDSGFDRNHPLLKGRIVHEECYSDAPEWWQFGFGESGEGPEGRRYVDVSSLCPSGENSQRGHGASYVDYSEDVLGLGHGTHVAGIVAAMAPDADLLTFQVAKKLQLEEQFTRYEPDLGRNVETKFDVLISSSGYVKALERVLELKREFNIVSVNLSLGDPGEFAGDCSNRKLVEWFPWEVPRPQLEIFERLHRAGTAVIVASGNSGHTGGIEPPACVGPAISVGMASLRSGEDDGSGDPGGDCDDAYYDVDKFINPNAKPTPRPSFHRQSSVGPNLDFVAPGVNIESANLAFQKATALPGNVQSLVASTGTSMAAPHIAGLWALAREAFPSWSVRQIERGFKDTGIYILDERPEEAFIVNEDGRGELKTIESVQHLIVDGELTVEGEIFSSGQGHGAYFPRLQSLLEREFPPDFRVNSIEIMPLSFGANDPEPNQKEWLPYDFAVANRNEQVAGKFRVRMGRTEFGRQGAWFRLVDDTEVQVNLRESGVVAPRGLGQDSWRFKGVIAPQRLPSGRSTVELLVTHVDTDGNEGFEQSFIVSVEKKDGARVGSTRFVEMAVEEGESASSSFVLSNWGDETLTWEILEKPDWISLPVTSGSIPLRTILLGDFGEENIGFTVDTRMPGAPLGNGRYQGDIWIKTNAPESEMVRVPVFVSVRGIVLTIGPRSYGVVRGESIARGEWLGLVGGGDVSMAFTADSETPWLEVVTTTGEVASRGGSTRLEYKIHAQDLELGYHFGEIAIKAGDGATEQTVTHQVRLLVNPPIRLTRYISSQTFSNSIALNGDQIVRVGTLKNYSDRTQTVHLTSENPLVPSESFSVPADSELDIQFDLPRAVEVGIHRGELHFDFVSNYAEDLSRDFLISVQGGSVDVMEGSQVLAQPRVFMEQAEIQASVDFGEILVNGFSSRKIVVQGTPYSSGVNVRVSPPTGDLFRATMGVDDTLVDSELTQLATDESGIRSLRIRFQPRQLGVVRDTLRIVPGYPGPSVVLHLRGVGVDKPRLSVSENEVRIDDRTSRESIFAKPSPWSGPWGSFSNGSVVRLEVEVNSVPPLLSGRWYRDGRALEGRDSVLTLFDPLISEAGLYSFLAENSYGETESESIRLRFESQDADFVPISLVHEQSQDGFLHLAPLGGDVSEWNLEFSESLLPGDWRVAGEATEVEFGWRLPIRPGDGVRFFRAVSKR